jgi:hypothetical protein
MPLAAKILETCVPSGVLYICMTPEGSHVSNGCPYKDQQFHEKHHEVPLIFVLKQRL